MNLGCSPTTGQLRAIGKLFSSDRDSETETQKFATGLTRVPMVVNSGASCTNAQTMTTPSKFY
jgi:hypothetical protein